MGLKYMAKPGAQFTDKQAQLFGRIIEEIKNEQGFVKKHDLVEHGKNRKSPLHNYFIWDDKRCGELHRLNQAQHLLNGIAFVEMNSRNERVYVNSFERVAIQNENARELVYLDRETVMSDAGLREQLVTRILKSYLVWRKQWSYYEQFRMAKREIVKIETGKKRVKSIA
jgi:hypothetical protein